jgi:hypothetical protein
MVEDRAGRNLKERSFGLRIERVQQRKRGADVRPNFDWDRTPTGGMGYR